MAKPKHQTAQDIYRARRQKEEQERFALLPPGLYNHGNTCFMNSVLQGLIATRLLSELVRHPLSPPTPQYSYTILARRSPQLTNGHGLGGEYEKSWVEGMPLGDVFLQFMRRAWKIQMDHRRENLSPKEILVPLGKKYDQYLDFAQQDAHEFLRQLLDAMRMEEQDIIKKRQPPPPPPHKKRRRTTLTPGSPGEQQSNAPDTSTPAPPPPIAEQDKLISLADMIFGGKLTSILVCQKCKHISQSYEEFNDLSLSIKPEDYTGERKRHRLFNFAKKLASFPSPSTLEIHRAASVPPSPRERPVGQGELGDRRDPPIEYMQDRRRSLEVVSLKEDDVQHESDGSSSASPPVTEESRHVEFVDQPTGEKEEKKHKHKDKDRDDEVFKKIGRRISITMKLGKVPKERKSRSRDRVLSKDFGHPSQLEGRDGSPKPNIGSHHKEDSIPEGVVIPPSPKTPKFPRPVSPFQRLSSSAPQISEIPRKRSKLPKPSAAEAEYLRQILADVTPSSANPFALFKPSSHHGHHHSVTPPASFPTTAQSLWLKMGQLPGIEECLRMFTAVEVLDGENMVGCRRCWKLENGVYVPRRNEDGTCPDEDSDSDDHTIPSFHPSEVTASPVNGEFPKHTPTIRPQSSSAPSSPAPTTPIPISASSPDFSLYSHLNLSEGTSVSSLPTTAASTPGSGVGDNISALDLSSPDRRPSTPGGLPIPLISTTAPESPTTARPFSISHNGEERVHEYSDTIVMPRPIRHKHSPLVPVESIDSLRTPRMNHRSQRAEAAELESAPTTDDSSGDESDASATTAHSDLSAPSVASTSTSAGVSSSHTDSHSHSTAPHPKKPKQVIMRPAYKRYLIATPPPVLVIHLKRFQQLSKTPFMSFSHGFRKLEDYVTFPEILDLTPFLAPKKEDFGLGKKKKGKEKAKDKDESHKDKEKSSESNGTGKTPEKCIYRLYAVVVHIGNMLGGHYIAYTALPIPPSPSRTETPTSSKSQPATPAVETPTPLDHASTPNLNTVPQERQWAYISDTIVRVTTLDEVLKAKAYICMYERI